MLRYAAAQYGMDELPEPQKNFDDPSDPYYEEYLVLQEQVVREDDADVLKEAALKTPITIWRRSRSASSPDTAFLRAIATHIVIARSAVKTCPE